MLAIATAVLLLLAAGLLLPAIVVLVATRDAHPASKAMADVKLERGRSRWDLLYAFPIGVVTILMLVRFFQIAAVAISIVFLTGDFSFFCLYRSSIWLPRQAPSASVTNSVSASTFNPEADGVARVMIDKPASMQNLTAFPANARKVSPVNAPVFPSPKSTARFIRNSPG